MTDLSLNEAIDSSFRRLCRSAGLDPSPYVAGRMWVKHKPDHARIVRAYRTPTRRLFAKRFLRDAGPALYHDALGAHRQASAALAGHPAAGVPDIVASDDVHSAYLMDDGGGRTMREVAGDPERMLASLRAAGRWLSAYHAATAVGPRTFRPLFMARHLSNLADDVEAGRRTVREPERFCAAVRSFADTRRRYFGQSIVAARHGDMNVDNLLITGDRVTGLDFMKTDPGPVGHDIARLLVSFMCDIGPIDACQPGEVVPKAHLQAFFEGYTLVGADDPGVRFMLRAQVLVDWNRMPQSGHEGTARRFASLERLAASMSARPARLGWLLRRRA